MVRRLFRPAISALFVSGILAICPAIEKGRLMADGFGSDEPRVWRDQRGRTLQAALSYVKDGKVMLKLSSGRDAVVPLEKLSDRDQEYLRTLSEQGLANQVRQMPTETVIDKNVEVIQCAGPKGQPPAFLTPHFEFHNEKEVSSAFVNEASRIFEGTYQAISDIPLGLNPSAPNGATRFQVFFQTDSSFRDTLNSSTSLRDARNIAGVYIPGLKGVFVPYSQLGVKMSGRKVSLRKASDTSTLIHEITHQLMRDWLPIMPLWMVEGMAEYISSVPYQNGRFDFKNSERGFKRALEKRGIDKSIILPDPAKFLRMKRGIKTGGDYADALVYVYYFMHLDRPEAPGASLAAYFQLLGEGRDNTQKLVAEFNEAVDAYNQDVRAYNEALTQFRNQSAIYKREAEEYNGKIKRYNHLVKQGIDPRGKVEIGEEPQTPVPPKEPVVPEILKKYPFSPNFALEKESKGSAAASSEGTAGKPANAPGDIIFDIYRAANDKAFPSLMRGRDNEELEKDMIEAFGTIGMDLKFDR